MQQSLVAPHWSADAVLDCVEDYQGLIVDLDNSQVVPAHMFADARYTLAQKIRELGLKPGERVVLALGNSPLFIVAWSAILMKGGCPILVHWQTPSAEIRRIADQFHARFVANDSQTVESLEAVGAAVRPLDCGWRLSLLWGDFGDATQPRDGRFLSLPGIPLHPTSGTTGEPKTAIRPAATAVAEAVHYRETIGIDHHDRILALAPMSHAYGHGWYVIAPMVTGADILTLRKFSAKKVFDACRECGITILPAVGAILDTLLFGAGEEFHDPTRRVFTGGAPVSQQTAANFLKIAGSRPRPLFGTTEAGGIAVARPDDPSAARGCVGRPFQGVEIEIRAPQEEGPLEDGIGLVHVRSRSVMAGYLVDEQVDTSLLPDGWFNTGDLGFLDEHGLLHLRGRKAEVINVSGMKVLPSEVENVIAALPGIKEVKVYAGKSRAGAYHVRAAVVAKPEIGAPQIKAHCAQHLVYYKRPSRITLLDAMPRSAAGKIVVSRLP